MLNFLKNTQSMSSQSLLMRFRSSDKKITQNKFSLKKRFYAVERRNINKILIANRGEIACRVMKTAKAMGIKTVAIYSEKDEFSKHVKMADEAVCVGPAPSSESYLQINRIVEACKNLGVDAVHPGYGFLSENDHFVKALEDNNIMFIGPNSHSIQAMGDKIQSKRIASDAGVHLIPGFIGEVDNIDDVIRIANEITYPVMIKASAGGGGKGMRVAYNDEEAKIGYRLAKQESAASFGDDRILIEKFIEHPRHIEVQVLVDKDGHGVYLNERECSIQRRNQKVVEEAPSPFMTPELRKQMGEQALMLAAAVGYESAGTVEFLVDKHRNFYFLEMNTRLQVEHPITEYITKVDIVEWMIKIAEGRRLSLNQSDIGVHGWAIESRIYAEDPYRGFLPAIGRLTRYAEPDLADTRCDSGILEGSDISIYYDPLISKLITYGNTRDLAIKQMKRALDSYVIRGLQSNIPFVRDIMENPTFVKGELSTNFIPEEYPDGFHGFALKEKNMIDLLAISASIDCLKQIVNFSVCMSEAEYSKEKHMPHIISKVVMLNGEKFPVKVTIDIDRSIFVCYLEGKNRVVDLSQWELNSTIIKCTVDNQMHILQYVNATDLGHRLSFMGTEFDMDILSETESELLPFVPEKESDISGTALVSPMAGTLVSLSVQVGDKISIGQEMAVVEAMKMQNVLRSSRAGIVKSINCEAGKSVALDQVLVEYEDEE
eukprot:TRINITY_DN2268_c0_g1_i1.p1 TRINITY_DN2268_c0_g1~~TRINITY_DN2268_c0_g1_i1.p1  ORF type:complete len:716 (-),score=190.26 TRINITY_DN2268_c0_g1_i1:103-2250(-)